MTVPTTIDASAWLSNYLSGPVGGWVRATAIPPGEDDLQDLRLQVQLRSLSIQEGDLDTDGSRHKILVRVVDKHLP